MLFSPRIIWRDRSLLRFVEYLNCRISFAVPFWPCSLRWMPAWQRSHLPSWQSCVQQEQTTALSTPCGCCLHDISTPVLWLFPTPHKPALPRIFDSNLGTQLFMAYQGEERLGRFQPMVFFKQLPECNPRIVFILQLLDNFAEWMPWNGVSVSFQLAGKVYIGSVNMAAYLEVYDVHIGEVLIHHQPIIFYAYILFVRWYIWFSTAF